MERCPTPRTDCKYRRMGQCALNRHHIYFPASDYKGQLERTWRNLDGNIEVMRKCDHDDLHARERPPAKPEREQMIEDIARELGPNILHRCLGRGK